MNIKEVIAKTSEVAGAVIAGIIGNVAENLKNDSPAVSPEHLTGTDEVSIESPFKNIDIQ